MANEVQNLDEVSGERGLPSVNATEGPSKSRLLIVLFLLCGIGLTALFAYLSTSQEPDESVTKIQSSSTRTVPTRTFELIPEKEEEPEPVVPPPPPLLPTYETQQVQMQVNNAPIMQNQSSAPPTLDKSSYPLMSSQQIQRQTTAKTADSVSNLLDKLENNDQPSSAFGGGGTKKVGSVDRSKANFLGNRDMIMAQGAFIPCVLQTKLVSTVAGMTSCVVTRNLYSDNGKTLLIERGSKFNGEYQAGIDRGQKRLGVIWNRLKTPNGVTISIDSPGTDSLGGSGLEGYVDEHFWKRFGGALMFSFFDDLTAALADRASDNQTINLSDTAESSGDVVTEIIKQNADIKPTLYKNHGELIGIFVARDLDFSEVYRVVDR